MNRDAVATRLAAACCAIAVFITAASAADKPPAESDAYQRLHQALKVTDWLPQADSLRMDMTITFQHGPEALAHRRVKLHQEHPGLDDEHPLIAGQLRERFVARHDLAWDKRRSSYRYQDGDRSFYRTVWNGRKGIEFSRQDWADAPGATITLAIPASLVNSYFSWLPWSLTGPNWFLRGRETEEVRQVAQSRFGRDAGWKLWGKTDFHGEPCYLIHRAAVDHDWDRFYVEVATGRLRGAKIGSWGIVLEREYSPAFLNLAEKYGITAQTVEQAFKQSQSLPKQEHERLQQDAAGALKQVMQRHRSEIDPLWEIVLTDYREVAPGKLFPMQQRMVMNQKAGDNSLYVDEVRELKVKRLEIDPALPEELFVFEIPDGTQVYDKTFVPPVSYRQDPQRTEEEWRQIVDKAKAEAGAEGARRALLETLVGRLAPEWPDGEWLNSEPLTWQKLSGKWVLLDFWHIGCGPCWGNLHGVSYLQAVHNSLPAKFEERELVVVGVHGPGQSGDAIKRAFREHWPGEDSFFPVFIDRKREGDEGVLGRLFGSYHVTQMPYAILVGPDGKVAAHGGVQEMHNLAMKALRQKGKK